MTEMQKFQNISNLSCKTSTTIYSLQCSSRTSNWLGRSIPSSQSPSTASAS